MLPVRKDTNSDRNKKQYIFIEIKFWEKTELILLLDILIRKVM